MFVAGVGVTASAITSAAAAAIYTGEITNWSELGGKPAPVGAVGREATGASRQVIDAKLRAFANIQYAASVKVVHLDPLAGASARCA